HAGAQVGERGAALGRVGHVLSLLGRDGTGALAGCSGRAPFALCGAPCGAGFGLAGLCGLQGEASHVGAVVGLGGAADLALTGDDSFGANALDPVVDVLGGAPAGGLGALGAVGGPSPGDVDGDGAQRRDAGINGGHRVTAV